MIFPNVNDEIYMASGVSKSLNETESLKKRKKKREYKGSLSDHSASVRSMKGKSRKKNKVKKRKRKISLEESFARMSQSVDLRDIKSAKINRNYY